jgi:hypothetical protein
MKGTKHDELRYILRKVIYNLDLKWNPIKRTIQMKNKRLTVIITLFWNITGDMNTQNMSYTNAQQRSTVATYGINSIRKLS